MSWVWFVALVGAVIAIARDEVGAIEIVLWWYVFVRRALKFSMHCRLHVLVLLRRGSGGLCNYDAIATGSL
jgi:hypothetical protein